MGKGGKRAGAGRPVDPDVGALIKVTVRLPAVYVDWAYSDGDGNVSRGLRRILEEYDQLLGTMKAGQGPKGRR